MFARILYLIAALLFAGEAWAQPVTSIGPVTPGNFAIYNSPTVIKDSGISGGGGVLSAPGFNSTSPTTIGFQFSGQSILTNCQTNYSCLLGPSASGFAAILVGSSVDPSVYTRSGQVYMQNAAGNAVPAIIWNLSAFPTFPGNGAGGGFPSTTNGFVIGGQGSTNDLSLANKSGTNVCGIGTGATILTCSVIGLTGTAPIPTGNGQGFVGAGPLGGLNFVGQGSVDDFRLFNKSGAVVCNNPTGTTVLVCVSIISPLHSGGASANSTLTLQSTTVAGTTDKIIFQTGSQVQAGFINTTGQWVLGTATSISLPTTPRLVVVGDGTNPNRQALMAAGSTLLAALNVWNAYSSRGTVASPTATQAGDILGAMGAQGYGTSFQTGGGAGFTVTAAETLDATHGGTSISFQVTPFGSSLAQINAMTIEPSGGIFLGLAGLVDVPAGTMYLSRNATAPPTPPITTGQLDIVQVDNVSTGINMDTFGTAVGNALTGRTTGGTNASKTATPNGANLILFFGYGWDSTNNYNQAGGVIIQTTQLWTNAAHGTTILFQGVVNNTTAVTTYFSVGGNGTASFYNLGTGPGGGALCGTSGMTGSGGGNITYNNNAVCTGSLRAYKRDIEPLAPAIDYVSILDEVMALKPRQFFFRPGFIDGGAHQRVGLIAEEVVKVDPRMATYNIDGTLSGVDYVYSLTIAFKAIQELKADNDNLRERLHAVERRVMYR